MLPNCFMKYLIANWKANKNLEEARSWADSFNQILSQNKNINKILISDKLKIILCPPSHLLFPLKEKINQKNLEFGLQDISAYKSGSRTGEITAQMVSQAINYVIVGHSERRNTFREDDKILLEKVNRANENNIKVIYCLRTQNDPIPNQVNMVAYEPVAAIGSGQNEPLENVLSVKQKLPLAPNTLFCYGGSVNPENVSQYINCPRIDALLIGGASLDPLKFAALAEKVE